jgi:hypothetical protein
VVKPETEPAFSLKPTFTDNSFLNQLSARAPPRL